MKNLLVFMILCFLSCQVYADGVVLAIQKNNDFLVISVENFSTSVVKVSKLFTQNPAFGLISLNLTVDGRSVGFTSPPNENLPSDADYVLLRPFDVVGKILSIAEVRRSYGIGRKCFFISTTYHDVMAKKYGALTETLKSDQIKVCQ